MFAIRALGTCLDLESSDCANCNNKLVIDSNNSAEGIESVLRNLAKSVNPCGKLNACHIGGST